MARSRLKTKEFHVPSTDIEEFKALYKLMYVLFGSLRAAAHALDVSYPTYRRWEQHPPSWPYYNIVMEQIIQARLRGLIIKRTGFTQRQLHRIKEELFKLSNARTIFDSLEHQSTTVMGAQDHLRRLLMKGPMPTEKIFKTRYAGGYSPRSLQRAALALGVVKYASGFGADKETYWRLPTLESDEDNED